MTMNEYYNSVIGKSIDTDGFPNSQPYQCVDLIKHYMKTMYSIPYGSYGNAVDYWYKTAPIILTKFYKVPYSCDIKEGDIIVWGDGTQTGEFGHVAISYQGKILEQNSSGRNYVTLDSLFTSALLGVLRPKEDKVLMTREQVITMFQTITGANPPESEIASYMKQDYVTATEFVKNNILSKKEDYMTYKTNNSGEYIKVTDLYIKKG